MKQSLPHIGSKELVSLPDVAIHNAPAKIDTGADYSSIWASDISEKDGVLAYKLFGPGSRYYTGDTVIAEDYSLTEVRNSFGQSEIRYVVPMRLGLGGKTIKISARLADRSRNHYPILIGKQTIRDKFLVDVSLNNTVSNEDARVLMLSSKPSKYSDALVERLNSDDAPLVVEHRHYDELIAILGGDARIELYDLASDDPLPAYDLIYFKTHQKRMEFATLVAEYAKMKGVRYIDREVGQFRSHTKISQYARLARHDLPLPLTVAFHASALAGMYEFIKSKVGQPFVLKDAGADRGEDNFLIHDEQQYETVIQPYIKKHRYFVAQKFIDNDGDYRCIVLDKQLGMVMYRRRTDEASHLNNTSTGGEAEMIAVDEFSSKATTIAIKTAIVLNRQVVGVDLMKSTGTGTWYVLEANNSPQLGHGAYTDEKTRVFAKFLTEQAEK